MAFSLGILCMEKAFKFRIYPNKEQIQQIEQTFGNCRFVYNYYLNKKIKLYKEEKKSFNYYNCANDLTKLKNEEPYQWLKLTDSTAYQSSLKNLETAYQKFFKEQAGFPKFKSKKNNKQSYKTKNVNNSIRQIDSRYLQIPKLGKIRCKFSRQIEGRILSATISKNSSNKYFVSICCTDVNIQSKELTGSVVGIDLGIKDFCIDSNGSKISNPTYLKKSEKKLAKLQRELSRKTIGSTNREKARIKVARCYEHITNQRTDFFTEIINSDNQW